MRKRRVTAQVMFLVFVVFAFWLATQIWHANMTKRIRDETIGTMVIDDDQWEVWKSPASFNGSLELRADSDDDGQYDAWITILRMYTDLETTIRFNDRDSDGQPDDVSVNIRGGRIRYELANSPNSAAPPEQSFRMRESTPVGPSGAIKYIDLNLDGWIDVVDFKKSGTGRMIVLEDRFFVVLAEPMGSIENGYWIEREPGNREHVVFSRDRGLWVFAPK